MNTDACNLDAAPDPELSTAVFVISPEAFEKFAALLERPAQLNPGLQRLFSGPESFAE